MRRSLVSWEKTFVYRWKWAYHIHKFQLGCILPIVPVRMINPLKRTFDKLLQQITAKVNTKFSQQLSHKELCTKRLKVNCVFRKLWKCVKNAHYHNEIYLMWVEKQSSKILIWFWVQLFRLTCLSNSIGGWAPYFSLEGILRSSTNTTHLLPGGGPYTPLRRLL